MTAEPMIPFALLDRADDVRCLFQDYTDLPRDKNGGRFYSMHMTHAPDDDDFPGIILILYYMNEIDKERYETLNRSRLIDEGGDMLNETPRIVVTLGLDDAGGVSLLAQSSFGPHSINAADVPNLSVVCRAYCKFCSPDSVPLIERNIRSYTRGKDGRLTP